MLRRSFVLSLRVFQQNSELQARTIASSTSCIDDANMLFSRKISFKGGKGHTIETEAVFQDSDPTDESRATVVALHGSPGSHQDFKYMLPLLREKRIRLVAVNYPGHGHTQDDDRLTWHNEERNAFVQKLIDELGLGEKRRDLILLGHSRGGENALQLGVSNEEKTLGIVLLNCPGLRQHRGIQPFWKIAFLIRLVEMRIFNVVLHPFLNYFYNKVLGLKVPSGKVAATVLLPLNTFAFEKQLPLIEAVSKHSGLQFLFCYSGSDFLIAAEHSEEFADAFQGIKYFRCTSKDNTEDNVAVTKETVAHFEAGNRLAAARFDKESHFLQKFRANYIVDVIEAMVKNHEKSL